MWKFVYSPSQTLNSDWYKACIIIAIEKIHITRTVLNERATTTYEREPKLTILLKKYHVNVCVHHISLMSFRNRYERREISLDVSNQSRSSSSIQSYKLNNDVNRMLTILTKRKTLKTECGMKNCKIKIKNDTRLSSEMPILFYSVALLSGNFPLWSFWCCYTIWDDVEILVAKKHLMDFEI